MDRRTFLTTGTVGVAATTLAAPAIAQDVRNWKLVTAWPKNLPGPGVAAQTLADRITTLSGGRINVTLYAAGEIVPVAMACSTPSRKARPSSTTRCRPIGDRKSKGILLFGSQPFGLRADEQFGWMYHGGGQALYDEMYGRFGIKPFLCGNSGPQWAGWFKNEINSVEDLKGLKFRTTGHCLANGVQTGHGRRGHERTGDVPGAADRCARRGRIHRAVDGFGARLLSGRQELLLARRRRAVFGRGMRRQRRGLWRTARVISKEVVTLACESLYNPVWTEYTTKHAQSLKTLVEEHGVQVRKLPDDVITAMGAAAADQSWTILRQTTMNWSPHHRKLHRLPRSGRWLHDLCRQWPDERPRGVMGY
jgi:TRAP-type mannitol/chloroaromatic compound transport system substrate-binding protein